MKKLLWIITSALITGCTGGNTLKCNNINNKNIIDINQLPDQPELIDSIALKYWDAVDVDNPDIEQRLSEFYYILDLGTKDPEIMSQSFDLLIKNINKYPNLKDSINNLVKEYLYTTESPYLDEEWYEVYINEALKYGDVSEAQKIRYDEVLAEIHRNRPGTKVPGITLLTDAGLKTISEIAQGKPLIILIYDTNCNDCQEAINTIMEHETLPKMMKEDRIKVLGINIGGPVSDKIDQTGWIDARAISDIDSQISFRSVPSAYLIDPQGTILIKDHSINSILSAIGFK